MKYIVYGKPNCTFCDQAKQLLESKNIDFKYVEVGSEISKEQLFETLGFEVRSVPQIVKMANGFGEYVGGFDQLKESLS